MRPALWHPPAIPSAAEQAIIKRIRRAKLSVFLREHRHELFDDAFQEELATHNPRQRGRTSADPARPIGAGDHLTSLYRGLR
jgi:hypothetical protein